MAIRERRLAAQRADLKMADQAVLLSGPPSKDPLYAALFTEDLPDEKPTKARTKAFNRNQDTNDLFLRGSNEHLLESMLIQCTDVTSTTLYRSKRNYSSADSDGLTVAQFA